MKKTAPAMPDTYFELVRRFPLVPIRDEGHWEAATEVLHGLIARDLDEGEAAYLDVLSDIVEAYESEAMPEENAPPGEVLKELIRQNHISQDELAKATGISRSTISAICQGTRTPTVGQSKKLGVHFNLVPTTFLPL